ncbi:MAG TPA: ribbon-helix-helix domain-containing protein [Polyangia bacterium]|nr:ribbon-helix-helix domain-containing protein [Polyangia bacterium]
MVRIPPELEAELDRHVSETKRKRSDVLREALRSYLAKASAPVRAHAENVSHLIGSLETRRPALAERSRRYVLESLRRGR